MTNTVLFFSRDPGGTNQLIALHALIGGAQSDQRTVRDFITGLIDDHTDVVVAAKDSAVTFWRNAGIEPEDWSALSAEECIARFIMLAPKHLVTATTDIDDRTDVALWQAARNHAIPSSAFTDHKTFLINRFLDQNQQIVQPDWVYTQDEDCRDILIDGGLEPNSVRVGGDLHVDLLRQRRGQTTSDRKALRSLWTVGANETVVLFASEHVREINSVAQIIDYDEFACLDYLITEMALAQSDLGGRLPSPLSNATIVIRPHPKDTPGKYAAYAQDSGPRIIISDDGNGTAAVAAADVVVGMYSSLFAEAAILDVPVVSLIEGAQHGIRSELID